MVNKFEAGKKYIFLPTNIQNSLTQKKVNSNSDMNKISWRQIVTCVNVGEMSKINSGCYRIKFKEINGGWHYWSVEDFDELKEEEGEKMKPTEFIGGRYYKWIFDKSIGSGGDDFYRNAEKDSKRPY